MSAATGLHCRRCDFSIPESEFRLACASCGEPLQVGYDLEQMGQALQQEKTTFSSQSFLEQWLAILPIDRPELIDKVSLGETQTPLVESSRMAEALGVEDLRFKLEMGPTLSLKDRGTSLCALKAIELGYDTICVASSGNNAASVAAYAARAGLNSVVFIQSDTSPAKVFKCLVYGARVVRVDGDMSVASRLCSEMLERHSWMHAGGPNPYRIAAKRTAVYEIVWQLGGHAPDVILIPCGGSAGIVAAYTGLSEMVEMGILLNMPKLVGVQLAACDPVTRAFEEGRAAVTPVEKSPSFSDALMNNNPYWGKQALVAARESAGFFISVSDQEVADSIRSLGSDEGIFTEPAGAVSIAGLSQAIREDRLPDAQRTVCMLTGHGLNAPQAAFDSKELPEIITPDVDAVESYLGL
jgi:threonine synthase